MSDVAQLQSTVLAPPLSHTPGHPLRLRGSGRREKAREWRSLRIKCRGCCNSRVVAFIHSCADREMGIHSGDTNQESILELSREEGVQWRGRLCNGFGRHYLNSLKRLVRGNFICQLPIRLKIRHTIIILPVERQRFLDAKARGLSWVPAHASGKPHWRVVSFVKVMFS